jgi:hypothetical protein
LGLPLIERIEIRLGHKDFTAHLEDTWPAGTAQAMGNTGDSQDVWGDILTDTSISSCCGLDQRPLLVPQAYGEAIELQVSRESKLSRPIRITREQLG